MTILTMNSNAYLEAWSRLATLYKEAMDANAEQLMVSSTRIIQEHTMQALAAASQSCAEALAKNAAMVQQQSLVRLSGANQRAMQIMGEAFVDALTGRAKTGGKLPA